MSSLRGASQGQKQAESQGMQHDHQAFQENVGLALQSFQYGQLVPLKYFEDRLKRG